MSYAEARRLIYLPAYRWVLENCLIEERAQLEQLNAQKTVILLDYETNGDVNNLKKPLSHAHLIKMYLENQYPN